MIHSRFRLLQIGIAALFLTACSDGNDSPTTVQADPQSVFALANSCVSISVDKGWVLATDATGNAFEAQPENTAAASRFLLRPSDLGKFLI